MNPPTPRRITMELTPGQQARIEEQQRLIAAELPDLIARNQRAIAASDEHTVSGELRRAIHASGTSLHQLAEHAGISPLALDEFLTAEKTLPSDAFDRLAAALHLRLTPLT